MERTHCMSHRRLITTLAVIAGAALAVPAAAGAAKYPPPADPKGEQKPPPGPHHTIKVCAPHKHKAKGCAKTIQAAVNRARAGDTVKVPNGTYHGGTNINGSSKRYLRIIGNPKAPSKVKIDAKGASNARSQNAFKVNGADQVTIDGFSAKGFKANGFFVINVTGYKLTHLIATRVGTYGVYAFNSKGGEISDSTASENDDSGFYIGQTPPQTKPVRSIVRNVKSFANVLGWSGTNMRYVTITKSQFYNNGLGIVPNALDSEKYAPPEDNVISDNDVFWNNFNYFKGAPFKLRPGATGDIPYPIGTGILLFGGRRATVQNNRVFGNYLVGIGALEQLLLKQKDAADLIGNKVIDNQMGLNGTDPNGRDLFYDGNGTDNCFSGNTGVAVTVPASGATMAPCPFSGANAYDGGALSYALDWVTQPDHEAAWVRTPHPPRAGITPLETYTKK
jgi:hypothetical protein